MLELLFLLLPIAAGYGWFMGRNSVKQNDQDAKESLSKKYSTGLNYLLSNQQDKAIDYLLETLAVEDDTVEAHFAMANLFRKRGELDRALKVHEHLVRQKHLANADKERAIYELGKDFHSAGLYDRAEDMFLRTHKSKKFGVRSINFLMHIFQQTKDWQQGVALKKVILKSKDVRLQHVLANFYCELANIAITNEESITVFELLEKALSVDPSSSRATLMMAQIYQSNEQYIEAIRCYQDIYLQDKDFFPDVIDEMKASYENSDQTEEFYLFIKRVYDETASTSALINYLSFIEQQEGNDKAKLFMLTSLKRRPTIRGFHYFVDMQKSADTETSESIGAIKELISAYINIRPRYSCRSCGFNSSVHYWACPSCHDWEQIKPVKGLEGE